MVQWLGALAVLAEDLGWIPRTYVVTHSHAQAVRGAHTYMQANTYAHKISKLKII